MRRDARTRAAFKKQLGLKARTVAPAEIRPASGLVLERMTLGRYRKFPRQFTTLRRKFFAKLPFKGASAGGLSVLDLAPLKRVSTRTNFSLRVGGRISARASVSKEALEIETIRRRTPFEVYRPKL
jgi:hypothetical protein